MRRLSVVIALSLAVAAFALGSPLAAQTSSQEHPAEIRAGACANAGDVVAPLANVVVPAGDDQTGAAPIGQSYSVVPVPLADLLGSAHMLVVYASPQEATVPAACNDIGGALGPDGALALALNPVNGSKAEGVAYFAPTQSGDGTAVTLLLTGSGGVRERPEREREPRAEDPARAGEDGVAGIAGLDGVDAADGADGQPGQPGQDGADGSSGGTGGGGGESGVGTAGGNGGDGGDGGDGVAGGRGGVGGDGGSGTSAASTSRDRG